MYTNESMNDKRMSMKKNLEPNEFQTVQAKFPFESKISIFRVLF